MFRIQFYDVEENSFQTLKFKIEENSGGGDCLFKTIKLFLQRNKKEIKKSVKNHFELRNVIVKEAVPKFDDNQFAEV